MVNENGRYIHALKPMNKILLSEIPGAIESGISWAMVCGLNNTDDETARKEAIRMIQLSIEENRKFGDYAQQLTNQYGIPKDEAETIVNFCGEAVGFAMFGGERVSCDSLEYTQRCLTNLANSDFNYSNLRQNISANERTFAVLDFMKIDKKFIENKRMVAAVDKRQLRKDFNNLMSKIK